MTVHFLCHILLVRSESQVLPTFSRRGWELYRVWLIGGQSMWTTPIPSESCYPLGDEQTCIILPWTLFAFVLGHSGNNILYPKIIVIVVGILVMFAAGFLWVDSGRGCLTTGRNCYTLQIHYSLILIDSPNYWRIFLEHLLCAIHRNHAASLFLGSQFIYFLLFLLLSESIFLCFESRYGFSCKSHKALQSLQWLNK